MISPTTWKKKRQLSTKVFYLATSSPFHAGLRVLPYIPLSLLHLFVGRMGRPFCGPLGGFKYAGLL